MCERNLHARLSGQLCVAKVKVLNDKGYHSTYVHSSLTQQTLGIVLVTNDTAAATHAKSFKTRI